MSPLVSIVTVNRNHAEGLRRTAESVRGQTERDFEWLVVDGGSTDGSLEVIEANAEGMAWRVSEADGGVYEAMNKGLARASGAYVLFLNSGDAFPNFGTLGAVVSELRKGEADLVYGDSLRCGEDGTWVEHVQPEELTLVRMLGNGICHQTCFFRRGLLEALGGFRTEFRICADWDVLVRGLMGGMVTRHVAVAVVRYEGGGLSEREAERREEEKRRILAGNVPPAVRADLEALRRLQAERVRLEETAEWLRRVRGRNVFVNAGMVLKWAFWRGKGGEG